MLTMPDGTPCESTIVTQQVDEYSEHATQIPYNRQEDIQSTLLHTSSFLLKTACCLTLLFRDKDSKFRNDLTVLEHRFPVQGQGPQFWDDFKFSA